MVFTSPWIRSRTQSAFEEIHPNPHPNPHPQPHPEQHQAPGASAGTASEHGHDRPQPSRSQAGYDAIGPRFGSMPKVWKSMKLWNWRFSGPWKSAEPVVSMPSRPAVSASSLVCSSSWVM